MANLLRVDIYELTDALTQKSMILRGEEIQSPLSVEQVGLGNSWRTFTETLRISGVNLDVVEISIPCKK